MLFDDQDDVVSIGDVAIAPNDANTRLGRHRREQQPPERLVGQRRLQVDRRRPDMEEHGARATRSTSRRIIVDPVDHDVVYVAALGNLWGPDKERGVFKTTDGGVTWTNVLYIDEDTGATELVMDPSNNKVLYAATYQRRRAGWGFNGGGPGSGIYKTTDAGRTWTKLTNGLPAGPLGRIGMDIYRANPDVLYARIEHADARAAPTARTTPG